VQVAGVQPVGGSRYVSLQAVVVEDRPPATATAREAGPAAQQAARLASGESVVFPREGPRLDARPYNLKRAKAEKKYREDGGAKPGRRAKR
jgi:hypothetical protein